MPWYLADRAVRAQRLSAAPGAASIQYRPARPSMSAGGTRELKYEFVQGDDSILGVHPASPGDWYSDPSVPLLIAEGQIKADSTLTGILLAAGVRRRRPAADRRGEGPRRRHDGGGPRSGGCWP